jgi:hypothetical protein
MSCSQRNTKSSLCGQYGSSFNSRSYWGFVDPRSGINSEFPSKEFPRHKWLIAVWRISTEVLVLTSRYDYNATHSTQFQLMQCVVLL